MNVSETGLCARVRSMKTTPFVLMLACAMLPIAELRAGLINVNFTSDSTTNLGDDGLGILGGDNWNRVQASTTTEASTIQLRNSGSVEIPVTLGISGSGSVIGVTQAVNGNNVQSEAWDGNSPDAQIVITLKGLIPNQVYRVALYSNREGSGASADTFYFNGEARTLSNPGTAVTALPGVEGEDYIVATVAANAAGRLVVAGPSIAGLQIAGRVMTSEALPALDATISTNPAALSGKGQNIRSTTAEQKQTMTRKGRGRRAFTFYPIVANKGTIVDRQSALLKYPERDLAVVLKDRETNENVTAAAKAGSHRFDLDGGEKRRFQMQLKPVKLRKTLLTASLCTKPSSGDATLGDCVAGAIRLKVKR